MNATAERFGPNATGSDDPDGFDVGEFWEFRFDLPGSFVEIDFRSFTIAGGDGARLTVGAGTPIDIFGADVTSSRWTPAAGTVTFDAGETIRLEAIGTPSGGEFWQLQSISIDTGVSPIAIGDMNADGFVDAIDAGPLVLALVDRRAFVADHPTVHAPSVGDIDGSGTFDLGDLGALAALIAPPPGDMNGDGLVNLDDVGPFIQALTNRPAYDAQLFGVNADAAGDVDGSGTFDLGDLSAFTAFVSPKSTAVAAPEPTSMTICVITFTVIVTWRPFGRQIETADVEFVDRFKHAR